MTSPLPLPDWMPWWMHLAILLVLLFFALMFLLMPFSVFGLKSRLDGIEARLDEIQGEIRSLALRLPEMPEPEEEFRLQRRDGFRPPIPPPPKSGRSDPSRGARTEPRLY
jgi:hypothetical protein